MEMTFEEKMKYMEEKYDGIGSMAFYNAQGGVKCKTMSWGSYLTCIDELIKIFKEKPELLEKEINKFNVTGKFIEDMRI